MAEYRMESGSSQDCGVVYDGIVAYNRSMVPFTQESAFIPIQRIMKDENNEVVAGIIASMYCWNCLYVDVLWVREDHRRQGLGSKLLIEVERFARENDCRMIHLDTFDFQAKEFYRKHGFEIFGILEDCPMGHKRYYM